MSRKFICKVRKWKRKNTFGTGKKIPMSIISRATLQFNTKNKNHITKRLLSAHTTYNRKLTKLKHKLESKLGKEPIAEVVYIKTQKPGKR